MSSSSSCQVTPNNPVPSATREGAEALAKILQRNRELFRYEDSELGNLEPLLADYLAGNTTLGEVLKSELVPRNVDRPHLRRGSRHGSDPGEPRALSGA